jgi:hypothetical protein
VLLNPPGGKVDATGRACYLGCGKLDTPNAGRCGLAAPHVHEAPASSAAFWWAYLASLYDQGDVDQALFVGFSLEVLRSAQQFPVLQPMAFPLCVPSQRVAFDTLSDDGTRIASSSPVNANVLVWLPPKGLARADAMSAFGLVFADVGAMCFPN